MAAIAKEAALPAVNNVMALVADPGAKAAAALIPVKATRIAVVPVLNREFIPPLDIRADVLRAVKGMAL